MKAWFAAVDAHPALCWTAAVFVTAVIVAWLLRSARSTAQTAPRILTWRFALGAVAVLLVWRWPSLLEVRDVGIREADALAAAMAVSAAPQLRWVADPVGSGPVTVLALLPPHALGVRLDYFDARLAGLLMDWGTCLLGLVLLRRWRRDDLATAAAIPWLIGWAATRESGVVAYSAAHAVWLLALGAFFAVQVVLQRLRAGKPVSRPAVVAAGACTGLLPFCGGAGAVVTAGVLLVCHRLLVVRSSAAPERRRVTAWYAGTAGYVAALGLAWLHGNGNLGFWWRALLQDPTGWKAWRLEPAPIAVGPWIGAMAAIGFAAFAHRDAPRHARARRATLAVAVSATLASIGFAVAGIGPIGRLAEYWRHPRSPLAQRLTNIARPDDTMAVWGVRPQLYVETRLPPTIRNTSAPFAIEPMRGGATRQFRDDYVRAIRRSPPVIFVDVDPAQTARPPDSPPPPHEWIPELAAWRRENYVLVSDAGGARIFVQTDHARARNLGRPGVTPLTLQGMTRAEARVPPFYLDATRIFAHAPSVLSHPVPPDARYIKGRFGIQPGAYTNPGRPTDGAVFAIEIVDRAGHRKRLFERRLAPADHPADREPGEFAVDLGSVAARQVDLVIETGGTEERDWTYWQDLRFEGMPE